jgi:hypothetical protein
MVKTRGEEVGVVFLAGVGEPTDELAANFSGKRLPFATNDGFHGRGDQTFVVGHGVPFRLGLRARR